MWKHVFHLNTSVETSFSLHKRLKEGGSPLYPRSQGVSLRKWKGWGLLYFSTFTFIWLSLCVVTSIGRLLGKCMCSSLPARLMEEFQARGTYNMQADLLGSFPVDVSPGTSGRFGWGHRTKFSPSVGGRGGHRNMGVAIGRIYPFRGWGSFWQKNSCQIFYTPNPNRHPQLYFSKQHFPSLNISLLPNSHPAKIDLKNIYFFENRSIGCTWCMLWL